MSDEQFDERDEQHHKDIQRLKNKHLFAIRRLQQDIKELTSDRDDLLDTIKAINLTPKYKIADIYDYCNQVLNQYD